MMNTVADGGFDGSPCSLDGIVNVNVGVLDHHHYLIHLHHHQKVGIKANRSIGLRLWERRTRCRAACRSACRDWISLTTIQRWMTRTATDKKSANLDPLD